MARTTKFKDGDLVLIEGLRSKSTQLSLFKIKKVTNVNQTVGLPYNVHVEGYRYGRGYEYDTLLSNEEDKVLTDPAEIAYWLLKIENHNEQTPTDSD